MPYKIKRIRSALNGTQLSFISFILLASEAAEEKKEEDGFSINNLTLNQKLLTLKQFRKA